MCNKQWFVLPVFQNTRTIFIKKIATIVAFFLVNTFLTIPETIGQDQGQTAPGSANQKATPAKNEELILKLYQEVINQRNLSYFDRAYVPNAIDHSAWEGQAPGTAGIKEAVKGMLETFSDIKVTVEDIIAEGDKVATREVWKGTKKTTGKSGSGSVMHIFWTKDGRVTEEWSTGWDWLDKF